MNKINYYHSLIFFNLCILLSAFEFLRDNSLLILSLFLILSLGISHGALDHIKGKKLLKLLNYKSTSTFYILYVLVGLSVILLWFLFSKILIDSLAAVPADKTSSIINTFPLGFAPIIFPPSP